MGLRLLQSPGYAPSHDQCRVSNGSIHEIIMQEPVCAESLSSKGTHLVFSDTNSAHSADPDSAVPALACSCLRCASVTRAYARFIFCMIEYFDVLPRSLVLYMKFTSLCTSASHSYGPQLGVRCSLASYLRPTLEILRPQKIHLIFRHALLVYRAHHRPMVPRSSPPSARQAAKLSIGMLVGQ